MPGEMKNDEKEKTDEIQIIDGNSLKDRIHVIRGVKVMLDYDLAAIYGYETMTFNQQVKNNASKFAGEDFMFQLTDAEFRNLISKNLISRWGGRRKKPWAFTESGIYMLMTVLHGDLAIKQSRALIRTFRVMKDYIIENRSMIGQHEYLQLSLQVNENKNETVQMRKELTTLGSQMTEVMDRLSNVVEKSEIAPFLIDMGNPSEKREYLFLDGQPMKADLAYMEIYGKATKSIHIIDDYINIKTLHLISNVKQGIEITIVSDNVGNNLSLSDYRDFLKEKPDLGIQFVRNNRISHDRFIVLDYGIPGEKLFSCGSSSKDAGNRMSTIMQFCDRDIIIAFNRKLTMMLKNPLLEMK